MSTAGKVLVVLILLSAIVWMILTAGVDQINRNGNQALITLNERVAKLQADVQNVQAELVRAKDQVHVYQEQMDRELAVINDRQNDVQRLASTVNDSLAHVKYELESVNQTLENAKHDKTEREAEVDADKKALAAAHTEFKALQASDEQLRERLASLRKEFKSAISESQKVLRTTVK